MRPRRRLSLIDGAVFSISSDDLSATVAPALGCAVLSLSDGAGPLLREGTVAAVAADPRRAAMFPCVPWFGRLNADFRSQGRQATLASTLPLASPSPLHGSGWISCWRVKESAPSRLVCALANFESKSGFPFAFEAEQAFDAVGGAFRAALTLRNADDVPMPAGLAFHPYFLRTPQTTVAFEANGKAVPAIDDGTLAAPPSTLASGVPEMLPAETLDHSFTGFSGEAIIDDQGGRIRVTSTATVLHVYAPVGDPCFCLEPATHPAGGFLDPARGRMLAPGETMTLTLTIGRAT